MEFQRLFCFHIFGVKDTRPLGSRPTVIASCIGDELWGCRERGFGSRWIWLWWLLGILSARSSLSWQKGNNHNSQWKSWHSKFLLPKWHSLSDCASILISLQVIGIYNIQSPANVILHIVNLCRAKYNLCSLSFLIRSRHLYRFHENENTQEIVIFHRKPLTTNIYPKYFSRLT